MNYADSVNELRDDFPDLANAFASFDGVTQVVDWLQQRGILKSDLDFISHDEFSYDFLIRLDPEKVWLVFGVN